MQVLGYVNGEPRTQLVVLQGFQKIPFGTGGGCRSAPSAVSLPCAFVVRALCARRIEKDRQCRVVVVTWRAGGPYCLGFPDRRWLMRRRQPGRAAVARWQDQHLP